MGDGQFPRTPNPQPLVPQMRPSTDDGDLRHQFDGFEKLPSGLGLVGMSQSGWFGHQGEGTSLQSLEGHGHLIAAEGGTDHHDGCGNLLHDYPRGL